MERLTAICYRKANNSALFLLTPRKVSPQPWHQSRIPPCALSPLLSSGGFQASRSVYIPDNVNLVAFLKLSYVCKVQTHFLCTLEMFLILQELEFELQLHHQELLHHGTGQLSAMAENLFLVLWTTTFQILIVLGCLGAFQCFFFISRICTESNLRSVCVRYCMRNSIYS